MSRVSYTTTSFGALLLYTFLVAGFLVLVGFLSGVSGLVAGGLVLIGGVMTVTLITQPAKRDV